ncbi:MAG: PQQ-binding-like beta-propeller repeat protein [Planctomycetes bacterium]|nr:PQQ-binding-like beta-propeller repeat protein [Planctomycetota bacterium]
MQPTRLLALFVLAAPVLASDWGNAGGNAGRNGLSAEVGPDSAGVLWSGGRSSIIAWQPVIESSRVFLVRQSSFPPETTGSPVVCQDLDTGAELWATNVPANTGDWTTWIAGVNAGRVYASRSGNGASISAPLYCLDAASGAVLWVSTVNQNAGAYDGVVFAANGDPVVASFHDIWRFDHTSGAVVWSASRVGSVSGDCGGAIGGDALYVADAVVGGHAIKKFDLASGAFSLPEPRDGGLHDPDHADGRPDGTIYLSRVQNNVAVDFFFAFQDSGSALVEKWHVPAGYSYASEFGVGPDGSVYHLAPGDEIHRLDPATGATTASSGPLAHDTWAPRIAADALGRVFVSNGGFANGRFFSFDADLTPRWSIAVPNINIGAPAIGRDGTLVVAGVGTNVKAYRTAQANLAPFCFGDGSSAACPCGNSGATGRGCANSAQPTGARLVASGAASLAHDTLVLTSSGELSSALSIFLQGTRRSRLFRSATACAARAGA